MTTLTNGPQIKRTADAEAITNLQRKGWGINNPPSHDPATQLEPAWDGQTWTIANKALGPVTMRSLHFALIKAGLEQPLLAFLGAIQDPEQRSMFNAWWTRSELVDRDHAVVSQLAQALGQTSEQVDALFTAAKVKDAES